jgi:hypothetical protein
MISPAPTSTSFSAPIAIFLAEALRSSKRGRWNPKSYLWGGATVERERRVVGEGVQRLIIDVREGLLESGCRD